jgi:RNA polymerase sigma-70 factor, ECF subfamily
MGRVRRSRRHDGARGEAACADDERLVDGLRRRSPQAMASLHEEYAAGIYSLALRVVRHAPDAEDITQDVLIRAFERLPREGEVLLRPWLYRLTLNRCYDHLRWTARRPLAPPDREATSPHDPFEQSELQRLLEESLGDLTRRQRAALLLKDVHGLSLVEVAACLDLTPGSVEVLLARARRAFRASFEVHSVAVGRPLPRSAGGLVALPLLPLPPGLAAPPLPLSIAVLPMPPAVMAPLAGPPLAAATGGGITALLGLPASVKTAMLIAAAAATVGSAEVAVTHAGHRPPRPSHAVAAVTSGAAVSAAPVASAHKRPSSDAKPAAPPSPSASPSPEPLASASPTEVAGPQPQGSPLGGATPTAAPETSASPSPEPTPTARAGTDPSPSTTPTVPATPSPETTSSPTATL